MLFLIFVLTDVFLKDCSLPGEVGVVLGCS